MDISNAYKQHQQIKELHVEKAEVQKEIHLTNFAYKLAFIGTFIVYFIFVWMMYVSDLWGFTTWLVENLSEFAALIVYAVLAITLPLAMALIKEIGYKHFAKYPNPKTTIVLIVSILAFAGVVYESISSSSQQQHISRNAAENSKTFQALSNTQITVMGTSGSEISAASQKLARCEEKLKVGKEKHCEGDKARLKALQQAQAANAENQATAAVSALEAKTKAMQDLKEDAYKPVFKAIRDSFGVSISTGVMLVTLFVSIIFEISHLLLILFLGQKLKRLEYIKQAIIQTEASYLQATGKTFKLEDFKDSSVLDMDVLRGENPDSYKTTSPGFGFTPSRASLGNSGAFYAPNGKAEYKTTTPLFKWQQEPQEAKQQGLGFIGFTDPNRKPEREKRNERSTYQRELSAHGIQSPADPVLDREEDKATIQRIIEAGLHAGSTTPETGSKPLANRPDSLYPVWVAAVKSGECKPSVKPTWHWIQKRIAPAMTGSKTNDPERITIMQRAFFTRAIREGLMYENQNWSNGKKKYIWIS